METIRHKILGKRLHALSRSLTCVVAIDMGLARWALEPCKIVYRCGKRFQLWLGSYEQSQRMTLDFLLCGELCRTPVRNSVEKLEQFHVQYIVRPLGAPNLQSPETIPEASWL
jgi:hypothetical protein